MAPIKVLVVDDSVFIRVSIPRLLESDPDIQVIDVAKDGREAVEKVKALRPDVVTLDVIMPVMDGLTALKKIMQEAPTPVVMLSSITRRGAGETIAALANGAVDFIPKPLDVTSPSAVTKIRDEIVQKVKIAAVSKIGAVSSEVTTEHLRRAMQAPSREAPVPSVSAQAAARRSVVAMGASTGGPSALQIVLSSLPANFPLGIMVVQHISPGFTEALVERLNSLCAISVKLARDGKEIMPGTAYFAQAGKQLLTHRFGGRLRLNLSNEPEGQPNRPSVDVTFMSVAENCRSRCCGVIFTGMGADGALGMKAIAEQGGLTIAQDEATSVVFGMAGRAIELNAVQKILPLREVAEAVINFAKKQTAELEEAV